MRSKGPLKLILTERFKKSALELDAGTRERLKKQIAFLASDPRHPSLRVKKIRGTGSVFEARVDRVHRFTFEFSEERGVILRVVGPHDPVLKKP